MLNRIATFRMRTFHKCLKQLQQLQAVRSKPKPILRNEPKSAHYVSVRTTPKVGRNEPCPCLRNEANLALRMAANIS